MLVRIFMFNCCSQRVLENMLHTQDKGVTGKIKVTPLEIMQFSCEVYFVSINWVQILFLYDIEPLALE